MNEHIMITLASIGLVGSFIQWFSWWVKLPAILFLLLAGIIMGPLTGWLNPDELFGPLLFPMVSLAVAVILFEGSLTLHFYEIKGVAKVVRRLVTVGLAVTWVIIAVATHYLIGFGWDLSFLFGALVVVTGPTVVVPMLRTVRLNRTVASILKWEGIVIDPLGALFAVLVYDFIISSQAGDGSLAHILTSFASIIGAGVFFGLAAGQFLAVVLRKHWLPEFLHNVFTLTLVFGVFAFSNALVEESGLLAVTLMGMWLANKKDLPMEEILDFKESLSILLISGLFILLAARIDLTQLQQLGWKAVALFLVIQLLARPAKVAVSTIGSSLSPQERAILAWIAPRGIVAAAVSALFALRLEQAGYEQAPLLVSLTFMVIIGTVVLQSATARPLARWLGVADPEPRGVLINSANPVARAIAKALDEQGFETVLADGHWPYIRQARMEGLKTFYGNPVSDHADRHLDLVGIGRMLGLSTNNDLNALSALKYQGEFGRKNVYTLALPEEQRKKGSKHGIAHDKRGLPLFGEDMTYAKLAGLLAKGAEIRATPLTEAFTVDHFLEQYDGKAIPLFAVSPKGKRLEVFSSPEAMPRLGKGWKIIALHVPETQPGDAGQQEKDATETKGGGEGRTQQPEETPGPVPSSDSAAPAG